MLTIFLFAYYIGIRFKSYMKLKDKHNYLHSLLLLSKYPSDQLRQHILANKNAV